MLLSEICHSEFPKLCYSNLNPQVFVIQRAQKHIKVLFTLPFLGELARGMPNGRVMGCVVCPQISSVEVLTFSILECNCIWR